MAGATKKTMPWPQASASGHRMANTKDAEKDRVAVAVAEAERGRMDGVGFLAERAIGELEKAGARDHGGSVEGEVAAGEA